MPMSSALATAFYRLYILHALDQPARPAALLGALHSSEGALPIPASGFSRAMAQLLDAGLLVAAPNGGVQLTPMGVRERTAQRVGWEQLVASVSRLLSGELPAPEPPTGGGVLAPMPRAEPVADAYRERVVVAEVRNAIRRARDTGERFALVLGLVSVAHPEPARARAMLHRALRETLGSAPTLFGGDVLAARYGTHGLALLLPAADAATRAEILRARLAESLAAMCATVRAFACARHEVRLGLAQWSPEIVTSAHLLRLAEESLTAEASTASAA